MIMKIYILEFNPMLRVNEHLAHGEFEIDLGKDVVKVVRCKDCEAYQTKDRPFPRCRITGRMKGADDYCSDGYTKDGE